MTQQRHFAAPRAQVLFRFTTEAIRNSGLDDQSFAAAVAEAYMASVAPPERIVAFHVGNGGVGRVAVNQLPARTCQAIKRRGIVAVDARLQEGSPAVWLQRLQGVDHVIESVGLHANLAGGGAGRAHL